MQMLEVRRCAAVLTSSPAAMLVAAGEPAAGHFAVHVAATAAALQEAPAADALAMVKLAPVHALLATPSASHRCPQMDLPPQP